MWSQSTVRGKLSLGKERKWDTRRWTHREGEIWTHRETRGGNFVIETQIRVQIDRGGNTYKKGFTKSETHRVTIVDKESICKNVWKQKITLSVTYLKANFYRRLRDRQEVERGSELLWFQ